MMATQTKFALPNSDGVWTLEALQTLDDFLRNNRASPYQTGSLVAFLRQLKKLVIAYDPTLINENWESFDEAISNINMKNVPEYGAMCDTTQKSGIVSWEDILRVPIGHANLIQDALLHLAAVRDVLPTIFRIVRDCIDGKLDEHSERWEAIKEIDKRLCSFGSPVNNLCTIIGAFLKRLMRTMHVSNGEETLIKSRPDPVFSWKELRGLILASGLTHINLEDEGDDSDNESGDKTVAGGKDNNSSTAVVASTEAVDAVKQKTIRRLISGQRSIEAILTILKNLVAFADLVDYNYKHYDAKKVWAWARDNQDIENYKEQSIRPMIFVVHERLQRFLGFEILPEVHLNNEYLPPHLLRLPPSHNDQDSDEDSVKTLPHVEPTKRKRDDSAETLEESPAKKVRFEESDGSATEPVESTTVAQPSEQAESSKLVESSEQATQVPTSGSSEVN